VEAGDSKAISALQHAGAVVMPLARNSNYLSADLSGVAGTGAISLLLPLKKQLIGLDLSGTKTGDSAMEVIRQCTALRSLVLSIRVLRTRDYRRSAI